MASDDVVVCSSKWLQDEHAAPQPQAGVQHVHQHNVCAVVADLLFVMQLSPTTKRNSKHSCAFGRVLKIGYL